MSACQHIKVCVDWIGTICDRFIFSLSPFSQVIGNAAPQVLPPPLPPLTTANCSHVGCATHYSRLARLLSSSAEEARRSWNSVPTIPVRTLDGGLLPLTRSEGKTRARAIKRSRPHSAFTPLCPDYAFSRAACVPMRAKRIPSVQLPLAVAVRRPSATASWQSAHCRRGSCSQ